MVVVAAVVAAVVVVVFFCSIKLIKGLLHVNFFSENDKTNMKYFLLVCSTHRVAVAAAVVVVVDSLF